MTFSHFQITFQQAGICISPVIFRSQKSNLLIFLSSLTPGRVKGSWNPIPKLTIVLTWKTPTCLKFGKTSNRAVENFHKENSESEHRTPNDASSQRRIWSHRTSESACFFGNDRSSHSLVRTRLITKSVYYEWASDSIAYLCPYNNSWYARASPRVKKERENINEGGEVPPLLFIVSLLRPTPHSPNAFWNRLDFVEMTFLKSFCTCSFPGF